MNPEDIILALKILDLGFSTLASYNVTEQAYIDLKKAKGSPLTMEDLQPLFDKANQDIDQIGAKNG
jgi:hypothetical protein